MSEADGLNRAQRLELAAYVAPVLRSASEKTLKRKVTLYDAETGEVTGYATGAEALTGLAKIQEIEHAVGDGIRPKEVVCEKCGRTMKTRVSGCVQRFCDDCRMCADCGKPKPSAKAMRCGSCAAKLQSKPPRVCGGCGASVTKRGVRCKACSFRARRKALPVCAACGKALSPSARVQPIKHCRSCWHLAKAAS